MPIELSEGMDFLVSDYFPWHYLKQVFGIKPEIEIKMACKNSPDSSINELKRMAVICDTSHSKHHKLPIQVFWLSINSRLDRSYSAIFSFCYNLKVLSMPAQIILNFKYEKCFQNYIIKRNVWDFIEEMFCLEYIF